MMKGITNIYPVVKNPVTMFAWYCVTTAFFTTYCSVYAACTRFVICLWFCMLINGLYLQCFGALSMCMAVKMCEKTRSAISHNVSCNFYSMALNFLLLYLFLCIVVIICTLKDYFLHYNINLVVESVQLCILYH